FRSSLYTFNFDFRKTIVEDNLIVVFVIIDMKQVFIYRLILVYLVGIFNQSFKIIKFDQCKLLCNFWFPAVVSFIDGIVQERFYIVVIDIPIGLIHSVF